MFEDAMEAKLFSPGFGPYLQAFVSDDFRQDVRKSVWFGSALRQWEALSRLDNSARQGHAHGTFAAAMERSALVSLEDWGHSV